MAPTTVKAASSEGTLRVFLEGCWRLNEIPHLREALKKVQPRKGMQIEVDAQNISSMDSAGAYVLFKALEQWETEGAKVLVSGLREDLSDLLKFISQASEISVCTKPMTPNPLYQLGKFSHALMKDIAEFLAFLGESATTGMTLLLSPTRIPWQPMLYEIEHAGVRAIAIVSLVALLAGVVIAYQGAVQLRRFGASIFIVDLLALSIVREMAPLLTAIMVAGRSGSAYTAQIGTMKVNEEIDALKTLGISPMETLVIPKLGALMVALPLLILIADLVGIGGGMVISRQLVGISYQDFITRLKDALPTTSFIIGILKGPIFALPLGLISCFRGFQVSRSAESVGRHTTISVVNTIFVVIFIDAVISVILGYWGV